MKRWYSIEKSPRGYTIWLNKELENGCGMVGVYRANTRKECVEYAKKNGIKISRKVNKF